MLTTAQLRAAAFPPHAKDFPGDLRGYNRAYQAHRRAKQKLQRLPGAAAQALRLSVEAHPQVVATTTSLPPLQ